jgi:hypothetical protein
MTSLSGFFFGVPIALVLLSTLTDEREERSDLKRLNGLSDSAWDEFSTRVRLFCSDDRINALRLAGGAVAEKWSSLHQLMQSCRTPTALIEHFRLALTLSLTASELDDLLARISEAVPTSTDLAIEWVGIQRSWAVLDSYVKIQRFELRQPWLPADLDSKVQYRLRDATSPIVGFLGMHHESKGFGLRMVDVPNYLRQLDHMSIPQRASAFNTSASPIYTLSGIRYSRDALTAADALEELRSNIIEVEQRDGWPAAPAGVTQPR